MNSKKTSALIILIIVIIIWASTFFIIKDTVTVVDPYLLVFYRTTIAAIFMLLVVLIRREKLKINKPSVINGLIVGFLVGISYISQTVGMKYTSSGHSAFISCSSVILVPIILLIGFKEKVNQIEIISLIITLIGLFLLTYDIKTRINFGDAITFISMIAFAINLVYQSKFAQNINILSFLFFQFLGASLVGTFGLFLITDFSMHLSLKVLTVLIYLAVFVTLFCFSAITWILKYLNPFFVALLISVEPVLAAVFGYFALGEKLNLKEFIGASIVMGGILYYQLKYNKSSLNKNEIECCKCT